MIKPRMTTTVVAPPMVEPVTVLELLTQLGLTMPEDPGMQMQTNAQMMSLIRGAREDCEDDMRRALMMQTRKTVMTGFPRRCNDLGWSAGAERRLDGFEVPSAPLMAIVSLSYVDLTGAVQAIPFDGSLGTAANLPAYTYQRSLGTETQPGRVAPGRYRWWPFAGSGDARVPLRLQRAGDRVGDGAVRGAAEHRVYVPAG